MYSFLVLLWTLGLSASLKCTNESTVFIITYDGFYNREKRHEILAQGLENLSISIHERRNQLSDFDTVEVRSSDSERLSEVLTSARVLNMYADARLRASPLMRKNLPLHHRPSDIPLVAQMMNAQELWDMGLKGQGVKVGVFDTGLAEHHPHFKNLVERTDWTNERTADDGVGHGTFVCGVIAASSTVCPGFAPAASLFVYKLFTRKQVSYTSWFLDAFNHAIMRGINVINLSIGGPDFTDHPFIDKVWELTANGIVLISAIGNDGPSFGTLNNPADQMDVIGVGGVTADGKLARFSSRGMTIWELPGGYGRAKPDVVSYGAGVYGSALDGRCRSLSGTSVASPVVAGAVVLMLSGIEDRSHWNPGVVKQALIEGAERLADSVSLFEQGAGRVNLVKAYKFMRKYQPMIILFPPYLDGTECPYMWPYCSEPLFTGRLPLIINITLISGLSVAGRIETPPVWQPFTQEEGHRLRVSITYSASVWPWAGYIAVRLSVHQNSSDFQGIAAGRIKVTVVSDYYGTRRTASAAFPLRVRIVPTPPRSQRLLWDQFRSLRYPPGYIPRDDLREKATPLDWNGDHPHTNYRALYQHLRADGFFIEILGEPVTCVDLSAYSVYLIVDPEEEFFPNEIKAIKKSVDEEGLNMIVFADWYNVDVMEKIKFFDENSKQWWSPDTGGSNVPGLNQLLQEWGVELGSRVLEGRVSIGPLKTLIRSGSIIQKAPSHALVAIASLIDIAGESRIMRSAPSYAFNSSSLLINLDCPAQEPTDEMILGEPSEQKTVQATVFALVRSDKPESGFVSVFTDSSCLDMRSESCIPLVDVLVDAAAYGVPVSFCEALRKTAVLSVVPAPVRSAAATHFASLSNVISSYSASGWDVVFRPMPLCHQMHFFEPEPNENLTFPVDINDRQQEVFGRVVSSDGSSLYEQFSRMEDQPIVPEEWMQHEIDQEALKKQSAEDSVVSEYGSHNGHVSQSDGQPLRSYLFICCVVLACLFMLMTKLSRSLRMALRKVRRLL